MYIKQINTDAYVVNIEGYENDLNNHTCMQTGFFEVAEGEPDEHFTRLNFALPEE